MQRFAGFDVFLLETLVMLVVAVFVGAVLLRIAIALYNAMVGGASSPNRVPVPEFEKVALIVFFTAAVQLIGGLIVMRVMATGAIVTGLDGKIVGAVASLICLAFYILVVPMILSAKLPTTFTRAMLVTMCYLLVVVLAIGILSVIVYGVMKFVPEGV